MSVVGSKAKRNNLLRMKAREYCRPIETDRGVSENELEEIALEFYYMGLSELKGVIRSLELDYGEIDLRKLPRIARVRLQGKREAISDLKHKLKVLGFLEKKGGFE